MTAANTPISAGSKTYVLFGVESIYGTAVTPAKHFGLDTNFDNNLRNNMRPNRGFKGSTSGGRDVSKFTAGKAELEFSIDFDMTDDDFLEYVMGTYTSGTNTFSGSDNPSSITVAHAIDNVATDRDEIYTGCVINSCTMKGAEGEPVTCNLSLKAADLNYDSSLTANTALLDKAPFTFSESVFEIPAASAIKNIVNDFEITIENNWTLHHGTSRKAVAATPGERVYRIKLNTKYVDDDLLNKALGGTGIAADTPTQNATFKIQLTRPDNDTLTYNFVLSPIDSYNLKAAINEPISESVDLIASSLTIVHS